MRCLSLKSIDIKFLLALLFFFSTSSSFPAKKPVKMKVYISTWDKRRVFGILKSITDSNILVRTKKGDIYEFSAENTKNLKIWKAGIVFPSAIVIALGGGILGDIVDDGKFLPGSIVGVPLGLISGIFIGDLIATKVNIRRSRLLDFSKVRTKVGTYK